MSGTTWAAIDLHHHVVPREYAKALSKLGVTEGLGVQLPKWEASKALDVMDAHGIARSVVSISAPGVYFPAKDPTSAVAKQLSRAMNEACAALVRDHPGRFGVFATLPVPDVDAALEELRYAFDELH
ncbi:amidohydrolase family protein [Arthrobacter sp. LAR12-1-1.1]|uniref:amidohydrolase family protein n=1 Tax=Arthrobacter sp. LAR12-1-1.1 TaxID=3135215 RepID=UPI00342AE27E